MTKRIRKVLRKDSPIPSLFSIVISHGQYWPPLALMGLIFDITGLPVKENWMAKKVKEKSNLTVK